MFESNVTNSVITEDSNHTLQIRTMNHKHVLGKRLSLLAKHSCRYQKDHVFKVSLVDMSNNLKFLQQIVEFNFVFQVNNNYNNNSNSKSSNFQNVFHLSVKLW